MTWDGACHNCGERGHFAANCPAKVAEPAGKPQHHMPSDDTIRARILRLYQPSTESELVGLVNTWKAHYTPGCEHPEAPRMPPGFLVVLQARQREAGGANTLAAAGWIADIRELLELRRQAR